MSTNPFAVYDTDRHALWDMMVNRDITAFINQDWDMVAPDFHEENFMGVDAGKFGHPDAWKLSFPTLEAYKTAWLEQAKDYAETDWAEDPAEALFRVTVISDMEIRDDAALIHKKFYGNLVKADGEKVETNWQTLYRCKKINDNWKITGFTGYMPHILGEKSKNSLPTKQVPANASQHTTAGPYSPVLVVNPGKMVIISGQAAIDGQGNVIGTDIETQTAFTLENCKRQLATAGCSLDDVFKVNVYLKDIADWARFNSVYKQYFTEPLPVRTAVQTGLLMTLLVEIEMWAVKS